MKIETNTASQLITKLVFALHFLSALPMVINPEYVGAQVFDRPKLIYYAITFNGNRQQDMLYAYERIAAMFQCFVGLCGVLMGVDDWVMPFTLMVYDAANVAALYFFM